MTRHKICCSYNTATLQKYYDVKINNIYLFDVIYDSILVGPVGGKAIKYLGFVLLKSGY